MNTNASIFRLAAFCLAGLLSVTLIVSLIPGRDVTATVLQAGLVANAVDDAATTAEDTATKTTVTANDTTGDFPHNLAIDIPPAHGNANPNGKDNITYTPALNYNGSDSYRYLLCDKDGDCASATVTITITPVNDPPNALDDSASTQVNVAVSVPVLANDSDIDSDSIFLQSFDGASAQGGDLSRIDNGTPSDLSDDLISYTPPVNFSGTDTFSYQVSDGAASAGAQVTVDVVGAANNSPTASNDNYSTPRNTNLNVSAGSGVLANDNDPDGDAMTAVRGSGPSNGSLNLNPDGSFAYTPGTDFVGSDSFTYRASDGQLTSNLATVSIQVVDTNAAPVSNPDQYAGLVNQTLPVPAPGVLGNDSDPNNDPLTAVLESSPSHGQLTLNDNGSFSYTPDLDFSGQDSFTYSASDGSLQSSHTTVTLTIQQGNAAPIAGADSYSLPVNNALSISAPGVLVNDNDPNGDPLSAILESDSTHGSLVLNSDGSFTYTPETNFFGIDSFTYRASDGSLMSDPATVTIQVSESNLAPIAGDDDYSTLKDQALNVPLPGVLLNDSDPNGDSLSAVIDDKPNHGTLTFNLDGSFTYMPDAGYLGSDFFRYRASDGSVESNRAVVNLSVLEADTEAPSVTWLAPVSGGDFLDVYDNEVIVLEVAAADNLGVASVRFKRWDALKSYYVEIGMVYAPPYRWELNTHDLNWGYNQINVEAYDIYGNVSDFAYIFLTKLRQVYLPMIGR